MRSIVFYLIVVPLAIVLVTLGVINRAPVTIALDPFSPADPALALTMPLYILVYGAIILGIIIGGATDWIRQGRWRREARERRYEARRWQNEAAALKQAASEPVAPGSGALTVSSGR